MPLATLQERTDTILPPQPRTSRETGDVVQRPPLDFLAGVADWPSIDALMHHRSLAMIAAHGIPAWLGFGGRMRGDGLLSFGSVSDVGRRILNEQSVSAQGFLRTDASGASWAVLPVQSGPGEAERPAFAVSWNGAAWPLDLQARQSALQDLKTHMARLCRPGRAWSQVNRGNYADWSRTCRQLRLVGLAMRLLEALGDKQDQIEISLADGGWSLLATARHDPVPDADEVWSAICSATEIRVAELRLGQVGWDPRVVSQAAAVSEAERIGPETFGLRLSRLWCRAVAALSGAPPTVRPKPDRVRCD